MLLDSEVDAEQLIVPLYVRQNPSSILTFHWWLFLLRQGKVTYLFYDYTTIMVLYKWYIMYFS